MLKNGRKAQESDFVNEGVVCESAHGCAGRTDPKSRGCAKAHTDVPGEPTPRHADVQRGPSLVHILWEW